MSLSEEYKRQRDWRPWARIFGCLPALRDQTTLDLGCGVGDQAAELADRGARVIGIDVNEELLLEARSKRLPETEFHRGDLRGPLGGRARALFDGYVRETLAAGRYDFHMGRKLPAHLTEAGFT